MAFRALFLFIIFVISNSCASTRSFVVELSDTNLAQGGVEVFRLGGAAEGISASFTGGEAFVLEAESGSWGVVAADLETEPGSYELILKRGGTKITATVDVVEGDYGMQRLKLPPDMVEFSGETLERIKREKALLSALWSPSSEKQGEGPLWSGPFIMPVEGRVTGNFGKKRILNGSPRRPHGGVDIAAPRGTPVKASNSGTVAFTGDFFFYGRFVVIDHGLGVFTLYAHLSAIDVEPGEAVDKGEVIGHVGATGRATGPHLHFTVKVGGAKVSPAGFFRATGPLISGPSMETSKGAASG
ncbi:MAG: M23 family metallopeptidase [Thermodesulfobacteriota bacterium]